MSAPGPNGHRVKLVDFGLAALDSADSHPHRLTIPGSVVGTLGYMAPEQLRGERCDERSDLFAAGVMAIEAISGLSPWTHGRYGPASVDAIDRRLGAGVQSETLRRVLGTCVALNPSDRFPAASQM